MQVWIVRVGSALSAHRTLESAVTHADDEHGIDTRSWKRKDEMSDLPVYHTNHGDTIKRVEVQEAVYG